MTDAPAASASAEAYYDRLRDAHLVPLWRNLRSVLLPEPQPKIQSALWRYDADLRPALFEAGDLVTPADAERRVLLLSNPALDGLGITHTLSCGLQMILGGERAPAHRHSQSAMRMVLEGDGAFTTINHERVMMERGDFITTPAWCWHEHAKTSDGPMVWMDGLDVPLVAYLGLIFSEQYPGRFQVPARPDDHSLHLYGGGVMPLDGVPPTSHSPLQKYPYARTREVLRHMERSVEPNPAHGFKVKYTHVNGAGHAMPTLASFAQLLPAGFTGVDYRATDATVYVVLEGKGRSQIDDRVLHWERNDIFVVPNWSWYRHMADEEVVLFSFSDRAVQEALHLWREEYAAA